MKELQQQLIQYIRENLKTTPARVSRWSKEQNTFPIGTRSIYRICRGKSVSEPQQAQMILFFQNIALSHNDNP